MKKILNWFRSFRKEKDGHYYNYVYCTCGCSPETVDKFNALYISVDASGPKEIMVNIWDCRTKDDKNLFLYLNKEGVTEFISQLQKAKSYLK
jgi:hypothetical protein